MATKKQQKRRQKRLSHSGYDHAPPAAAPRRERVARNEEGAKRPPRTSRGRDASPRVASVPEPSLYRSARRGLLVYGTLYVVLGSGLIGGGPGWVGALWGALPAAAIFVPFDYYMGGFMYKRMTRKVEAQAAGRGGGKPRS